MWAANLPSTVVDLSIDPAGNLYVLAAEEPNDAYEVLGYSTTGELRWTRKPMPLGNINLAGYLSLRAICTDRLGNSYIIGSMWGTGIDFGNGVQLGSWEEGVKGALLAKYDSLGKAKWAQPSVNGGLGQHDLPDRLTDLSIDLAGNVCVVGNKTGQVGAKYSFFSNEEKISSVANLTGNFVLQFNSQGQPQWASMIEGECDLFSVAIDKYSSIYVAGWGTGNLGFGNGVKLKSLAGNGSTVLAKFNSSGKALWARSVVENGGSCTFDSLALDSHGDVYALGRLGGKSKFDFGSGVTATGSGKNPTAMLVKYSASGDPQWAQSIPLLNDLHDYAQVRVGALYVYVKTSEDSRLLGYDFSGDLQWEMAMPQGGWIHKIHIDQQENVYLIGDTYPNQLIDFGNNVVLAGGYGGYIAKYRNTAFTSRKWAISTDSRVRVRSAGSLQSETLGYLDKGDLVEVLEQGQEQAKIGEMEAYWFRIQRPSDGLRGWSYGYYLEMKSYE